MIDHIAGKDDLSHNRPLSTGKFCDLARPSFFIIINTFVLEDFGGFGFQALFRKKKLKCLQRMQLVELNHRQQINVIRKHTRRNAQPKKANDLTTPFAPSLISVADLPKVHSTEIKDGANGRSEEH